MPVVAHQIEPLSDEQDLAEAVLAAHDGDPLAALRSVIADAEFLHGQLEIASALISPGLARGWKPKFQREE
ncbi:MAG: hypothetical protein QMD99_02455 [Rhizobiaceae bacterium]|nr:hypothetical protein [Rhizobiaceae bacterium]